MVGALDALSMSPLSWQANEPAYYIEDWRISVPVANIAVISSSTNANIIHLVRQMGNSCCNRCRWCWESKAEKQLKQLRVCYTDESQFKKDFGSDQNMF